MPKYFLWLRNFEGSSLLNENLSTLLVVWKEVESLKMLSRIVLIEIVFIASVVQSETANCLNAFYKIKANLACPQLPSLRPSKMKINKSNTRLFVLKNPTNQAHGHNSIYPSGQGPPNRDSTDRDEYPKACPIFSTLFIVYGIIYAVKNSPNRYSCVSSLSWYRGSFSGTHFLITKVFIYVTAK
jgi:hypothetical protein